LLHFDRHIASIDEGIFGELLADELVQQFIAALVAFRASASVRDIEQIIVSAARVELCPRCPPLNA
jgi:hypothetical protein